MPSEIEGYWLDSLSNLRHQNKDRICYTSCGQVDLEIENLQVEMNKSETEEDYTLICCQITALKFIRRKIIKN